MKNRVIAQFAVVLFCALSGGRAGAVCLMTDNPSSSCRYPAGDAWCAAKDGVNLYAYKDDCGGDGEQTDTSLRTRPPVKSAPGDPVAVWNCAQAKTSVERLVCNNPEVRALDVRMGALYAELQARGKSPERMQKDWLRNQRNTCDETDCLRAVYAQRIRYFESLLGTVAAANKADATPVYVAPAVKAPASSPKTALEPPASTTAEPVTITTTSIDSEPTPPTPDSQTGIPALPQPEVSFPYADRHQFPQDHPTSSSVTSVVLVMAGAAALFLLLGLFVWVRRPRVHTVLEYPHDRLEPMVRWIRSTEGALTTKLRRQPGKTRAGTFDRSPASISTQSPRPDGVCLPVETLARLRALAQPGESLSSVVGRAVDALEAASDRPPADDVLSRLQILEARLAHLEGGSGGRLGRRLAESGRTSR